MLQTVHALVFVRLLGSGRTHPGLFVCKRDGGERLDVVVKRASECDAGQASLCREAIAACLAGDLGIPITEPVWVLLPLELLPGNDDGNSTEVAFGSVYAGHQFSTWLPGTRLDAAQGQIAAEIVMLDAIIQNFDRRVHNPNCLVRGDDLRIIDHEASFIYGADIGVMGWQAPWAVGGMQAMKDAGHIFLQSLKVDNLDFNKIGASWRTITDGRLDEYRAAIPPSFRSEGTMRQVDRALSLVRDARDHIDDCLSELRRILT